MEWVPLLFFADPSSWASTLRLTVLEFCIINVLLRSQNILDLLRTKSSGKLWPTPPHRCRASIRTLNGPLLGARCNLGFDLIPRSITPVTDLGLLGLLSIARSYEISTNYAVTRTRRWMSLSAQPSR